jgi:acyl-coenzyme A thioesterase 9
MQVVFRKPVDVGDLVKFTSCVLFSSTYLHTLPSLHVEITAHVINPAEANSDIANTFRFTFLVPAGTSLPRIVPESYDDALRIVAHHHHDLVQHQEDVASCSQLAKDQVPI